MRTTLNLDDDVLYAARHLATQRGTSLGHVMSVLARRGLQVESMHIPGCIGIPLLARERLPDTPITLELVNALRDG